jgi:thiamine biosynthesis lipoprotein
MTLFFRVCLLISAALPCLGGRTVYQAEDTVMGPIIARITAVSNRLSAEEMQSAVEAAVAEIHKVDALMSNYKPDTDISRLNEAKGSQWVRVDPQTFGVLEESQRFAELTGGAFDATVMPLSELWGFWPIRDLRVPTEEEIQDTLSHVGYKKLSLDRAFGAVQKSDAEGKVDLGGIAKGYAVDRAMEVLKQKGLTDALVEIGGETGTMGKNKEGKRWRIGVLHPSKRGYLTVLDLTDEAVATSGDYMSVFILDGKRYSHLIDPRTGKPISNDVASVTVIAKRCLQADALATAVSVMGVEEGLKLIESLPDTEAIIAKRKDSGGELEVHVSRGLKKLRITP